MRRFLTQRSNVDPTSDPNLGVTSSPVSTIYRPSVSQNAVYHSNTPISCLDASPDGQRAVLAGRHILKIVSFDGLAVRELTDLRSIITAQPATKNRSMAASISDQLSICDAKWAGGDGKDNIFTACANGKIFMYDLARLDTHCMQIREDSRQINTLDVNPHRPIFLLSGSQDGIVRLFDLRSPVQTKTGFTFRANRSYKCNADGIRQVKWGTRDGLAFATATEQGVILKWDMRKPAAPLLRINGHEKACSSISWHPDGDHLISGGWDNKCYVWDLSEGRRQKPKYTINAPAPVSVVAWRPGLWSATAQGKRAAQVAVSYDDGSHKRYGINTVQIWDLARPTMPFKEIDRFDASPAGMLWHNHDLLWTAGQDGLFAQSDVAFAPRAIDRHSLSTLAFSSRGHVAMFLNERAQAPRPRHPVVLPAGSSDKTDKKPLSSYGSSPVAPMLSISRSDSENDVVGTFLGSRRKGSTRQRLDSNRSSHQLSTTPPSGPGDAKSVLPLEQGIKASGTFKNQQTMSAGLVPGATKVDVYRYLATTYLETLETHLPANTGGSNLLDRILVIMEIYANAAEDVSQFRLAQSWRILAYAISLLLKARAQFHLEARLHQFDKRKHAMEEKCNGSFCLVSSSFLRDRSVVGSAVGSVAGGEETPRKAPSSVNGSERPERPAHQTHRSLLSEEIDSTSNVTTPLARPVPDHPHPADDETTAGKHLLHHPPPSATEPDGLVLPPAIGNGGDPRPNPDRANSPRRRLDSESLSVMSYETEVSNASSTEGYDFYDTEALSKAIDVPTRKAMEHSHPHYVKPGSPTRRAPLLRNDSVDSYGQMFSISDGSHQATMHTASSDERNSSTKHEHSAPESNENLSDEDACRLSGQSLRESLEVSSKLKPSTLDRGGSSPNNYHANTSNGFPPVSQTATTDSFASRSNGPVPYSQESSDPQAQPPGNGMLPAKPPVLVLPADVDYDESEVSVVKETDYLPWEGDPPYPFSSASPMGPNYPVSPPVHPYTLIARALSFEAKQSAVNAAAIILLLKPLVPADVIDKHQATAILHQFHTTLMSMKLFIQSTLLRNLCVKGWSGIDEWRESYPSIFGPSQQHVKVGIMCSSCRKPRDIIQGDARGPGIWVCDRCATVNGPCAVCGHREAAAGRLPPTPLATAVARVLSSSSRIPAANEPVLSTWWYCPPCGHGGHSTCLEGWHGVMPDASSASSGSGLPDSGTGSEFSDGCCPLDGCGHACLPGKWRNETNAARTGELSRQVSALETNKVLGIIRGDIPNTGSSSPARGRSSVDGVPPGAGPGVRGDWNEVPQSRAVESVRETFVRETLGHGYGSRGSHGSGASFGFGGGGSPASGILSSSPGRMAESESGKETGAGGGGGKERRKSVKFAGE